ncbi:hypothetical protein I4U23_012399 [Adineta vaga]|nr:hypothetical protein I4U23_012399 [Adineta vaga]
MALFSFGLLFIVVFILLFFRYKTWIMNCIKVLRTYETIPCPSGKLPILGNLLNLPISAYHFSKKLDLFYEEAKSTDLYCLWLGTHPLIAFFHPVGLEHFFASSKHITKSSDYIYLHPWLRTGLLTSTGAKWKNRRRIITPAFHNTDLLNNFVEIFNEQTAILIQRLQSIQSEREVNLYPYIASCALDIICEAAMGLSIGAQQKRNSEYVDAVLKLTDIILKRQRMPWMWPDIVFQFLPEGREHDRHLNTVHQFTKKVIDDRARDFHASNIQGKRLAFLDLLLKQMHEEQLTLLDIQEEVDTFMFEGHDTTAAAMNFTCFMIASHPKVQEKLHEEIDRVFGNDLNRSCTMEDVDELKYLECVIKETLRLFPSVPFIAREIQEDFTYHNHKLLKGSTAVLFIYYIHRDPKYFPDPERFDPDRFLPENSVDRPAYAFVPFSAGSRNCIGQRFALLEEKIILSSILRRFKLKTSQLRDDLHLSFEVILRSENGAFINIFMMNQSIEVDFSGDIEKDHPKCVHGPTLLFHSSTEHFFACSACRDRQECDIHIPYEKRQEYIQNKQKNRIKFNKQSSLHYCYTCSITFLDSNQSEHVDHHYSEVLTRRQFRQPCRYLLQPLEKKRTNAQFFFSQSFIDYLLTKLIHQGSWDSIICIGCPTIFENLNLPKYRHKFRSYLLDYDHRLCPFYSMKQMLIYNMFNGHIFSKKKFFQEQFLATIKNCLVIIDPPFGGFHRALAYSIEKLFSSNDIQHNFIVFNPYFLEKWINDAFPNLKMLDYKVEYTSNSSLHLCRGKKGSPVRMFTDICPSKCPPLDETNYKYCFECNRYTLLTNQHCFQCQSCTSKDGLPYKHCSLCQRCVKAERIHCMKCNVCHLKDQCMTETNKRKCQMSDNEEIKKKLK